MTTVVQYIGAAFFAIGLGLLVGAVLSVVAGVGVGLVAAGAALVLFGYAAEREVTDGTRSTPRPTR